jgi:hypothetical protein
MSDQKRSGFKVWEIVLLVLAVLLLGASAAVYFSGYSVTSLLFGLDESGGGQAIGKVSQQDGALKREREGASEFKPVNQGVPLYTKDVLVTGGDGKATISLDDGSTIEMAPSTMIRLEMESKHDLNGIFRVNHVQVISGEVKGTASTQAKSKLVIRSQDEESEVVPNAPKVILAVRAKPLPSPSPRALPSPKPLPLVTPSSPPPSPVPSPSPSGTPERAEAAFIVVSPTPQAVFNVAQGSQEPRVPVTIRIALSKYGQKAIGVANASAIVRVYRVSGQASGQANASRARLVLVAQQPAQFKPNLSAAMIFTAQSPGGYRIEVKRNDIKDDAQNIVSTSDFQVAPEFEGIALHKPEFKSEKPNDDELRRTQVQLGWDAYPGVSTYRLQITRSNGTVEDLEVPAPNFSILRENISDKERKYVVSAPLPGGWLVKSRQDDIIFDFTPPNPVTPANNAVLTQNDNLWDGRGVLFTWQKTGISEGYILEVSEDPGFSRLVVNRRQKDNFLVFKPASRDVTYYWRVRAFAKDQVSAPSEAFQFSVKRTNPAKK